MKEDNSLDEIPDRFCGECGCEIEIGELFCPNCGNKMANNDSEESKDFIEEIEKVQNRICQSCGYHLEPEHVFCPICGVKLEPENKVESDLEVNTKEDSQEIDVSDDFEIEREEETETEIDKSDEFSSEERESEEMEFSIDEDLSEGEVPRFCEFCGFELIPKHKFCTNCGEKINLGEEAFFEKTRAESEIDLPDDKVEIDLEEKEGTDFEEIDEEIEESEGCIDLEENSLIEESQSSEESICFCENCGAELEEDQVFCMECGTKVFGNENEKDLFEKNDDLSKEEGDADEFFDRSIGEVGAVFTCPNCGEELEEDQVFCTNCGIKIEDSSACESDFEDCVEDEVEKRYCFQCGNLILEGQVFCTNCGTKVE